MDNVNNWGVPRASMESALAETSYGRAALARVTALYDSGQRAGDPEFDRAAVSCKLIALGWYLGGMSRGGVGSG